MNLKVMKTMRFGLLLFACIRSPDYKLKIDIPKFDRNLHIEFLNWVQIVMHFFNYMETPLKKQVKLVVFKPKRGSLVGTNPNQWPI